MGGLLVFLDKLVWIALIVDCLREACTVEGARLVVRTVVLRS